MRRLLAIAAVGLIGLGLTGCGASISAATSQQVPSVPGVNWTESGVAVRNALVPFSPEGYPSGGDAPITLTVINENDAPVRLVDASSPLGTATLSSVEAINSPAPPAGELTLAPGQLVHATFQLSGLSQAVTGPTLVPFELSFDNGTVASLVLSLAPPEEPVTRGERLEGVYHH